MVDPVGHCTQRDYEIRFDCTIKAPKPIKMNGKIVGYHPGETVEDRANKGTPYKMDMSDIKAARSIRFDEPIFLEDWQLPAGAFGESCGPS